MSSEDKWKTIMRVKITGPTQSQPPRSGLVQRRPGYRVRREALRAQAQRPVPGKIRKAPQSGTAPSALRLRVKLPWCADQTVGYLDSPVEPLLLHLLSCIALGSDP